MRAPDGRPLPSRVILAGHSHATALGMTFSSKWGHRATLVPLDGRGPESFALNGSPWKKGYWQTLVRHAANSTIFIVWRGNQHLVRFLLTQQQAFDFCLARHPDEPRLTDASLVPEAQVRDVFSPSVVSLRVVLQQLKAQSGCTPVVLGTPPPKGNDERLRSFLEPELRSYLGTRPPGAGAQSIPLTPLLVRRKLWLVLQDLMEEVATAAGCRFEPVPTLSLDSAGFLRDEYWTDDVSHANASYGDLFWSQIVGPSSATE